MDSKARRLLWNDIISLIREKRVVVFTSHSMEECEALCNRLVIMVDGRFKCLGSPGYLKNKFGIGYIVKITTETENCDHSLIEFIEKKFDSCKLKDFSKNTFEFVIPLKGTKLSELFLELEKNRQELKIFEYTINETNLDELFINFAKQKQ
jgi:ABC-type multidrug transport system ATPase subunit